MGAGLHRVSPRRSTLEWCPPGRVYLVMCVVVRAVEALGNAAAATASLTIVAHTFPDRVSMVMVSSVETPWQRAGPGFGLEEQREPVSSLKILENVKSESLPGSAWL